MTTTEQKFYQSGELTKSQNFSKPYKSSDFQVKINLFKAAFGFSLTFFASALNHYGVTGALIIMPTCSYIAYICVCLLLDIVEDNPQLKFKSLAQVVAFVYGENTLQTNLTICSIFVTQLSLCIGYVNFILEMLTHYFCLLGYQTLCKEKQYSFWVILLIAVPFSQLKTLKAISYFSLVANFIMLIDMVIVSLYSLELINSVGFQNINLVDINHIPIWWGLCMMSQALICLIFEIRNSAQNTMTFRSSVQNTYILNVLFMNFFPLLWYLSFGEKVQTYIFFNLTTTRWDHILVPFSYCYIILVSFSIQIFPITQVLDQIVYKKPIAQDQDKSWDSEEFDKLINDKNLKAESDIEYSLYKKILQSLVRSLLTISICFISYKLPSIHYFTSLIGSITLTYISIIIPCLCYLKYFQVDDRIVSKNKIYILIVCAVLGGISGFYNALMKFLNHI